MLSSVALAAAFYIAWANFGRRRHALTWALAYVVGALQFGATLSAQSFPSETSYLLTENALAILFVTLGVRGHCQRTNCTQLPLSPLVLGGIVYLVSAALVIAYPHAGLVHAVVPAYAAIALLVLSLIHI